MTTPLYSFPFSSRDRADLVVRTEDGTHLFVEKCLLTRASPFFENLLSDGRSTDTHEDLPVVTVPESYSTFVAILQLCYPEDIPAKDFMERAVVDGGIAQALDKYLMERPSSRMLRLIDRPEVIEQSPLEVYVLARLRGWHDVAGRAAYASLRISPRRYSTEGSVLHLLDAGSLLALNQYYWKCQDVALSAYASARVDCTALSKMKCSIAFDDCDICLAKAKDSFLGAERMRMTPERWHRWTFSLLFRYGYEFKTNVSFKLKSVEDSLLREAASEPGTLRPADVRNAVKLLDEHIAGKLSEVRRLGKLVCPSSLRPLLTRSNSMLDKTRAARHAPTKYGHTDCYLSIACFP